MNQHSAPSAVMPKGATDCHMHVFGDLERYPPAARRSYTPQPALLEEYEAMCATIGITRNVFVTASAYGSDNRAMLDAMRVRGDACRGIAVIDETTTDAELREMDALGVRGVRINAATFGLTDPRAIGVELGRAASRVAQFGWHVQLFAELPMLAALHDELAAMKVPVVIDHMGLPRADRGLDQAGFAEVLDLLTLGHCWVKIGGTYRVSTSETDFSDATPFARALAEAAPERCVWGTDWPHIGHHRQAFQSTPPLAEYRRLDDGGLVDLLSDATTASIFRRVLVDNPAALYGF